MCIYLGVALPVIGIGVIAATVSLFAGVATFAAVTGIAALAVAAWHWKSASPEGLETRPTTKTADHQRKRLKPTGPTAKPGR